MLYNAVNRGESWRLAELLGRGIDVNARYNGATALMWAARNGQPHYVKMLLVEGAEVDAVDDYQNTALMWAASFDLRMAEPAGELSALCLLLEAGADPNRIDDQGDAPLILAVTEGNFTAIGPLLAYGADLDAANLQGTTALVAAAAGGYATSLRLLIEAGSDVNKRGALGWTSLHFAVHNADMESLEALLEAKADMHVTDDQGISPLLLAIEQGESSIVARLKSVEER